MSPRYPLEIGASLGSQGEEPSAALSFMAETSLSVPSSNAAPLEASPPPTVRAIGRVALAAPPEDAALQTPPSEVSHKGKVSA